MIAANYRKHPDAMALQLPLPFSRLLVWHTSRPTTRVLRTIRAARGAAFKLAGRIAYPVKVATPGWVKTARRVAQALAAAVKEACIFLDFESSTMEQLSIDFNNELVNQSSQRACLTANPRCGDPTADGFFDCLTEPPAYKSFCTVGHKSGFQGWGKYAPYSAINA